MEMPQMQIVEFQIITTCRNVPLSNLWKKSRFFRKSSMEIVNSIVMILASVDVDS